MADYNKLLFFCKMICVRKCGMQKVKKYQILNRTFARRIGKTLSDLNKNILATELPEFSYSSEKHKNTKFKKVFLEIGFGMGAHFINQLNLNPENLYIGVEVYLNGVANILKQTKNIGCDNFMIWPNDLDLILDQLPHNSLDGIYILFPDPWHKRRYLKKRLFNVERLDKFKKKLKSGGFIAFASDIEDYFDFAVSILQKDTEFVVENKNTAIPHEGYTKTKYHLKAENEGRDVQFLKAYINQIK